MGKVFLAYNQIVTLKFKIVALQSLFKKGKHKKLKLVLNINRKITSQEFHIKKELIDVDKFSVYCKPFLHTFPVLSSSYLEMPILDDFWKLDIYLDDECVDSRKSGGVIMCERKRFVERTVGAYLEKYLHYEVKFFSGANNPDLIFKQALCDSAIQCEITEKTNSDQELTYEKFSRDIEKYERYQREDRYRSVRHLLIISCAAGISKLIERHLRDFVTVITFNDFYNLLCSLKLKQDNIINKDIVRNIITNSGIQKCPHIYETKISPFEKKRIISYRIDFTCRKLIDDSPVLPLLYIRDIEPFELIKIIEFAKLHDAEFRSKSKFKEILLEPRNLAIISKKRTNSNITNELRIQKEWWLITPIQLGYLDNNCKITGKGLFLLELLNKQRFGDFERVTIRKLMGYDFLNAPGVKEFIKLVNDSYKDCSKLKSSEQRKFLDVLANKMIENQLSSSLANARKDCANLFKWLSTIGYCEGLALNFDKIKEDYSHEGAIDERAR